MHLMLIDFTLVVTATVTSDVGSESTSDDDAVDGHGGDDLDDANIIAMGTSN